MTQGYSRRAVLAGVLLLMLVASVAAQSSRPRRVRQQQQRPPAEEPLLRPEPRSTATSARKDPNAPLLDVQPVKPVANTVATGNTTHAYQLLQQKQFAQAAKEAKAIAAQFPNDSEAWKIAGFAELNLKQYPEAAKDLEKAVELQRKAKQEDPNTADALAQAYVLSEQFQQALPLLVTATTRQNAKPDSAMLYYRGLAEYKTGKPVDAEKTFKAVVKLNPKDPLSLFYLGQIALAKNDFDGAVSALNRATVNDPRMAGAWTLLTSAYLRRAAINAEDEAKADADYLNAVRAGEGLIKVRTDEEAVRLFGQALIGAKQYARAATALDRAAQQSDAKGVTFYLLGIAHSRTKSFPKAIAALQTAATKTPEDPNVYRELGYAYEVTKQYAKALSAYDKGLGLVPDDPDFKEAADRVRPFAK